MLPVDLVIPFQVGGACTTIVVPGWAALGIAALLAGPRSARWLRDVRDGFGTSSGRDRAEAPRASSESDHE